MPLTANRSSRVIRRLFVIAIGVLALLTTPAFAGGVSVTPGAAAGIVAGLERAYAFVHAVQMGEVVDYVGWVEAQEAEQTRLEALRAAQVRSQPTIQRSAPSTSVSGDCYGGVVPDYIVSRESGGNPNAVNGSSGAWGCFQFMPSTWASSCSDLSRDVAGQKECASRISDGGRSLAPWSG